MGAALVGRLGRADTLREILADAIRGTTEVLDLQPNSSPSSTVAIVQIQTRSVEVLVLGDTTVIVGFNDGRYEVITDDRLSNLAIPESAEYQRRLAEGAGYDDTHRRLLRELQRQQHSQRNRSTGYWIAEADPSAADQAVLTSYSCDSVGWVVVATDGARDTLEAIGIGWRDIAVQQPAALLDLLARCHDWEADVDPDGRRLPRAKRHDDKTIAVIRL
ncbi:hypothetical protein [Nocardia sp. NBC_00416]|uniref:hypothetical protein n=1 Tax=Nocardia sp. NBC_00416 TaxID=2975991 RepID=UPI002E1E506A